MTKTTSYEISKKLAELNFEKKAPGYYHVNPNGALKYRTVQANYSDQSGILTIKSYDLETMLDSLPKSISRGKEMSDYYPVLHIGCGFIAYESKCCRVVETWPDLMVHSEGKKEPFADMVAKMLILLLERNIVKVGAKDDK